MATIIILFTDGDIQVITIITGQHTEAQTILITVAEEDPTITIMQILLQITSEEHHFKTPLKILSEIPITEVAQHLLSAGIQLTPKTKIF